MLCRTAVSDRTDRERTITGRPPRRTKWLVLLGIGAVVGSLTLGCETHPGSQGSVSGPTTTPATAAQGDDVEQQAAPPDTELVPAIVGPPPNPSVEDLVYRIGPYDELQITVFDVPDLTTEGQVNLQGLIVFPLLGPITVAGMTPAEAEASIARLLAVEYVRNPRVTVYVKNSASLNVTISGAVGSQGVHPLRGRKTLTDILAEAGGVSPVGKKREVILYRAIDENPDNLQAYVVDYQQILDGKIRDPLVVGNDKIYVPASGIAIFFSPIASVLRTWAWPYRPGL
jgi:polysaccharide export outer membrane protein